jgi:hypothetical protein
MAVKRRAAGISSLGCFINSVFETQNCNRKFPDKKFIG